MMMRLAIPAVVVAALLSGVAVAGQGPDCPLKAAAREGASRGYERDRTAALELEKRESASSDLVGRCVSGITSVVVAPTFPALSDIFARTRDRICHVASDRIREATNLPVIGIPGVPGTSIPVPITPPLNVPTTAPVPPGFWERIWR